MAKRPLAPTTKRNQTPRSGRPKHLRLEDMIKIKALSSAQQRVFDEWKLGKNLILGGSAGTGKTFISLHIALSEVLDKSTPYENVIVCRSAVPVRDMGFLPGTAEEKELVYTSPYKGITSDIFGKSSSWVDLEQSGKIKFLTTSYLRGLTLDNSIIIVDEMQNCNEHELDSIITRCGQDTRIIFAGDYYQSDFKTNKDKTGILHFLNILTRMSQFSAVQFTWEDIVRSSLVKDYIMIKEKNDRD